MLKKLLKFLNNYKEEDDDVESGFIKWTPIVNAASATTLSVLEDPMFYPQASGPNCTITNTTVDFNIGIDESI